MKSTIKNTDRIEHDTFTVLDFVLAVIVFGALTLIKL